MKYLSGRLNHRIRNRNPFIMSKISLIIRREYITRVRKKSFIIMSIIGPVLFAAFIVVPGWLATLGDRSVKEIAVVEADPYGNPVPDSLQRFRNVIPDKDNITFVYLNNMRLDDILKTFKASNYDGILYLPQTLLSSGNQASVELYYREPPSVSMESHITQSLEEYLFNEKLSVSKIPTDVVQSLETSISLDRINWKNWPSQAADTTDVKRGIGMVVGFLIYFFIFFFGVQVMRGVMEEKTNRIVEVIVSSVSPFQLMMGKIVGIGLTGLTQFAVWIALTIGLSSIAQQAILPNIANNMTEQVSNPENLQNGVLQSTPDENVQTAGESAEELNTLFAQLGQVNYTLIIGAFIFYFMGAYLLYGSLFAAVGAASDTDTDTQQFMLPITIPLIIGMLVMINSSMNPSGQLAVIFSIIPFTSPIVMMSRIPFDIPAIQILVSAVLLVLTFLATTWMAAKIYRTGILMYGKKVNYRELWKWIRYRS